MDFFEADAEQSKISLPIKKSTSPRRAKGLPSFDFDEVDSDASKAIGTAPPPNLGQGTKVPVVSTQKSKAELMTSTMTLNDSSELGDTPNVSGTCRTASIEQGEGVKPGIDSEGWYIEPTHRDESPEWTRGALDEYEAYCRLQMVQDQISKLQSAHEPIMEQRKSLKAPGLEVLQEKTAQLTHVVAKLTATASFGDARLGPSNAPAGPSKAMGDFQSVNACRKCTFENPLDFLLCDMCREELPSDGLEWLP